MEKLQLNTRDEYKMAYSINDNYCSKAENWQAVPSESEKKAELLSRGIDANPIKVKEAREETNYSCKDSYQMGTIRDRYIYVSTSNEQHEKIVNSKPLSDKDGVSGYFSDKATIDDCTKKGVLDNGQYNRELQISPYYKNLTYKPHVDCFKIDSDKMEAIYGTREFRAAIAKCEANNQFGEGGGNQGFNPYLTEMINNGCLKYDKSKGFSDLSLSDKEHPEWNNSQEATNSTVSKETYRRMKSDAKDRSTDCVKNNTPHPSKEVINSTGYPHNSHPVEGHTGNATPISTQAVVTESDKDYAVVIDKVVTIEEESPPPLHDLNSLQIEANQRFGMTAAETLACAQGLYEAGLLSYPRTSSHSITPDMEETVSSLLSDSEG